MKKWSTDLKLVIMLHEKYRNTEFFWSVFSCIWTDHEDLLRKYPYSVRIQEIMTFLRCDVCGIPEQVNH